MMLPPLPDNLWNRYTAAHLLNRAGFGGTPAEIQSLEKSGPEKAVFSFLNADDDGDLFPSPKLLEPPERIPYQRRIKTALTEAERMAARKELNVRERESMLDLRLWWLNRMRWTNNPLLEKATLFWHGHFATSNQKVNDPYLMWRQNEILREHALGKFPALLKAISRDPAMIRWLDLSTSSRSHPNENFAREVMELFTLGEGHYSEEDIQEAAKCFTGYRVMRDEGTFRFSKKDHDNGVKTFFGKSGYYSGDDIIDMITARPECARFIGRKLWKFFVSEDPDPGQLEAVSTTLLGNGYDIGATLGMIFRSGAFYSPSVMHGQIKGPVQWMIQTTRMLEIPLPDTQVLENSLSVLGQIVFNPPNVKGWDGGRSWISASSLLYRYNLAAYLMSGKARILGGGKGKVALIPLDRIVPKSFRSDPEWLLDHLTFRIFNAPVAAKEMEGYRSFLAKHATPYRDETVRDLMLVMMSTPAYQLN